MTGRGRGKEVALQVEVESQEEWEELISKEGLTVIDVYQEWCGPCKAMVSNFKRFKNEIGDELLRFAVAKADSIEALERYRGKCEPCFLFYAGGLLVDVIRGANSPQLQKKMIYQLAYEHKVLEGLAERKEIRDPNLPHREDKHGAKAAVDAGADESDEDESSDEEEDETRDEDGMKFGGENIMFDSLPQKADIKQVYLEKMFTVGIIKPDIYADGKADEIIDKIRESGFDVLEQMERIFAPEEVQELYSSKKEEEDFHEIIKDMCNGPSIILVLSKGQYGEGIIQEWHEFLGPKLASEAKEHAPKSLRALYCSSGQPHSDGFHGSSSAEAAKRELNLFFPDFVVPKISITHIRPQRKPTTIAIIRPAALESLRAEILEKIAAEQFTIEMQREMQMSRSEAEKFYQEQRGEPYFEELLDSMTSGPMLVMALHAAENVVEKWRSLLGSKDVEKAAVLEPDSFRGKFCVRGVNVNQFHGSESEEIAQKEFDYFFPMEQSLVAIKPHAFYNRDAIIHAISQAGFRIVARKEMELPEDKINAMYRSCQLKEFYSELAGSMKKGVTTFLILSKPNAVTDWRALSGPTDPEVARAEVPRSIRALFGKDILRNAVHSPSSLAAAKEEIGVVFGDVEFDADGSLKKKKKQKRRKSSEEIIRHRDVPVAKTVTVVTDDREKPAVMATPDKYEKEKPVLAGDHVSVFAPADSQLEDLSHKPLVEELIHDLVAEMATEDSQVEDIDAADFDASARMDLLDDQDEDLSLKDALELRLLGEERPPDRWGVEVEVPLEDEATAVPFTGEIQLEVPPEVSWAEHVREMERLAELKRETVLTEKQRVQELMDESIKVKERMAEEGTIPELLAEEEEAPEEISEEPREAEPLPEQPVEEEQQVEELTGEQPHEEEHPEEVKVEPPLEETVPVQEEQIVPPEEPVVPEVETVLPVEEEVAPPQEPVVPPEEHIVPTEEHFFPPEEHFVPQEEPIVPPEEHIVPPEEHIVPADELFAPEVYESEEERETSYPMPDCAKEEIEGLPKEEEPADLPTPDFEEHIGEGEEEFDGEKDSPRQGHGEHSEGERDKEEHHEDELGERGQHDAEEDRHSQEHLDSEEHRGSQEHLHVKEHRDSRGSQEHRVSQEHLDAKEHRGSKGSQEHRVSQEHLNAKEHRDSRGSQEHRDSQEDLPVGLKDHIDSQHIMSQEHIDSKAHRGSKGSQENRVSQEHLGSKEHRDSKGSQEHKVSQEHLGSKEHRDSQGSQEHKVSQEHIGSKQHRSSEEHIGSDGKNGHKDGEQHKEGEDHKEDAEHNNEIHSQKDAGEHEGDNEDEHK